MRQLVPGERLVVATHSPGKLAEIAALLQPLGVSSLGAASIGLVEPDETATDFAGNARIKAIAAARASQLPALADDSGFSVAALDGAPGVLSARWAGPQKDFAQAIRRVEQSIGQNPDRRAWFVCALCLAWPDAETLTWMGRVDGSVCFPPRGNRGFGYDPIFVPRGSIQTFGEMEPTQKDAVSHRARAAAQLAAWLKAEAGRPPLASQ